jgi:hypothetical protein
VTADSQKKRRPPRVSLSGGVEDIAPRIRRHLTAEQCWQLGKLLEPVQFRTALGEALAAKAAAEAARQGTGAT